jgi:hypothetical protein
LKRGNNAIRTESALAVRDISIGKKRRIDNGGAGRIVVGIFLVVIEERQRTLLRSVSGRIVGIARLQLDVGVVEHHVAELCDRLHCRRGVPLVSGDAVDVDCAVGILVEIDSLDTESEQIVSVGQPCRDVLGSSACRRSRNQGAKRGSERLSKRPRLGSGGQADRPRIRSRRRDCRLAAGPGASLCLHA